MKSVICLAMLTIGMFTLCGAAKAEGWTGALTVTSAFTEDSDLIVAYTDGPIYTPRVLSGQLDISVKYGSA